MYHSEAGRSPGPPGRNRELRLTFTRCWPQGKARPAPAPPARVELRLGTAHVGAATVSGSVEVTVFALVLTSKVVSVFAAPFVRSLAVTWKIAELAVGTTASCLVALDKSDDSVGQTDWRLLTMLNAACASVESIAPTANELDDAAFEARRNTR